MCIFFQHVIKRVRNNIFNSKADGSGTRELWLSGHNIVWEQWEEVQLWDSTKNPCNQIHQRLSRQVVNLDSSSKMRNKFADYALNEEMYSVMKVCTIFHPKYTNPTYLCSGLCKPRLGANEPSRTTHFTVLH